MKMSVFLFAALLASSDGFMAPARNSRHDGLHTILNAASSDTQQDFPTRRNVFQIATTACAASVFTPLPSIADDGLDDLPPEAQRSYLQYRVPLQISADYYVWELQDKVGRVDDWGEIGELFSVKNNRGQGNPSRLERDFVNPMRILGLSMPPDIADEMRASQFKFEKAMATITKATAGIRRDLPVEVDKNAVNVAKEGWEQGRVALNEFFVALNGVTGLSEMKTIPPAGPNQDKEYGRSQRKYLELMKTTKLCQNRGGPALSAAWGQLMVTGTVQDSCGIAEKMENYFYQ